MASDRSPFSQVATAPKKKSKIYAEARQWLYELRTASEPEILWVWSEFDEWMRESVRHREAFDRTEHRLLVLTGCRPLPLPLYLLRRRLERALAIPYHIDLRELLLFLGALIVAIAVLWP